MKCLIKITKERDLQKVVRRRFIPIKMMITGQGDYIQEEVKLPFTTNKVVGILTTSQVNPPCNEEPAPPRYYHGITKALMVDTSFLEFDQGKELEDSNPPELLFEGEPTEFWYLAVPASDRIPFEIWGAVFQQLGTPVEISIQQEGYCDPQPYHLWSKQIPNTGFVFISFEQGS